LDSLRNLEYQLSDIDIIFSGDDSRAKREFETKPSINSRLGSVYWYSFNSTTAPSGSQKENFKIAEGQYQELHQQIGDVSKKVNTIKQKLIESGAPYFGDEMPE